MPDILETENALKANVKVELIANSFFDKVFFTAPTQYKKQTFYKVVVKHNDKEVFSTRSISDRLDAIAIYDDIVNDYELPKEEVVFETQFIINN